MSLNIYVYDLAIKVAIMAATEEEAELSPTALTAFR